MCLLQDEQMHQDADGSVGTARMTASRIRRLHKSGISGLVNENAAREVLIFCPQGTYKEGSFRASSRPVLSLPASIEVQPSFSSLPRLSSHLCPE